MKIVIDIEVLDILADDLEGCKGTTDYIFNDQLPLEGRDLAAYNSGLDDAIMKIRMMKKRDQHLHEFPEMPEMPEMPDMKEMLRDAKVTPIRKRSRFEKIMDYGMKFLHVALLGIFAMWLYYAVAKLETAVILLEQLHRLNQ